MWKDKKLGTETYVVLEARVLYGPVSCMTSVPPGGPGDLWGCDGFAIGSGGGVVRTIRGATGRIGCHGCGYWSYHASRGQSPVLSSPFSPHLSFFLCCSSRHPGEKGVRESRDGKVVEEEEITPEKEDRLSFPATLQLQQGNVCTNRTSVAEGEGDLDSGKLEAGAGKGKLWAGTVVPCCYRGGTKRWSRGVESTRIAANKVEVVRKRRVCVCVCVCVSLLGTEKEPRKKNSFVEGLR